MNGIESRQDRTARCFRAVVLARRLLGNDVREDRRPEEFWEWASVGEAWLFQSFVLNLAEESRPQEGVGLLDVGEVRRQERSFGLKSTILINRPYLSALADNEEFVAVADNLKTVVWVCLVHPFAKELRSCGSAAGKEHPAEQAKRDYEKDR